MDPDSLRLAASLVAALVGLGFCAVAEGAVGGLSRARHQRLLEEGRESLSAIGDFVERPGRYVAAAGVARTLFGLAVAALAVALALRLRAPDVWLAVAGAALALAVLVLDRAASHAVVAGRAEEVALAFALPIRALTLVLTPITRLTAGLADWLARLLGRSTVQDATSRTSEELSEFIGERLVEEGERHMIDAIFDLEDKAAREIMVSRMDVVALPATLPVAEALDVIIKEGYSRLPVYGETIDDVVGILYAKDLLPLVRAGSLEGQVRDLVRPAYFIPESKKIGELLRELQVRKVHIAVVVDEYGGTAGLVTIEDLLEEIVGEIQDEFDVEEDKIVEGKEGEAVFAATVSIDDVNDTLDLHLRGEEVDTIGGLVYERLGKVPVVGDQIQDDGATVTVVSTAGRRIKKVKVARASPPEGGGEEPVA